MIGAWLLIIHTTMAKQYNPKAIEKKWQKEWERTGANTVKPNPRKKKFYGLVEFPYPSGDGLHTGHVRGYTAMDVISRKRRLEGYNVLYPIGWDAFGLPTENYAIKTGIHPEKVTKKNTDNFRRQMKSIGFSFDWSREINTTDPAYYKWTQWIFLQMFKRGLAYKAKMEINWCPSCKIGLANEESQGGVCERCGGPTEKREKEQWMLAITKYADRLDKDLDKVDYWEKIKVQQRNWIGRSEGALVKFEITNDQRPATSDKKEYVEVFTTRIDTIFSGTFLILAPEHPLIEKWSSRISNLKEVLKYAQSAKRKTDIERTAESGDKTGVEVKGITVINPATGEGMPVWVSDFVLSHYGTGAVFADAHDERDYDFAKKYNIPLKISLAPFFTDPHGKDAPRPDKPTVRRRTAFALVKHWSEDKYLCLDWEKFGWHSGIIGGIEEGEDAIEAAKREIVEETGYKHPIFKKIIGEAMHTNFFAAHKDVNRYADGVGMLFQLKDDAWEKPDENETKHHQTVWIEGKNMDAFLNLKNFQYMWQVLKAGKECFTGEGVLINSGEFDGLMSKEAREKITAWLAKKGLAKKKVNYKLRDWVFSRQRYWGEPIPMVHCEACGWVPLSEKELPLKLPKVKNYKPTDNGESPLAAIEKWVKTKCPKCGGPARRETDTMPNWAGSSWYFLRYVDPKNTKALASKKALDYFTPVDWYNGGMEHTTLHLLYSRFWHKFLYDIKVVPTSEPYKKRTSHGLILAEGGVKMSKSKGNVVNPDMVVQSFGADTLRVYEMFMGPFDQPVAWSMDSISGSRRFLEKVWKLQDKVTDNRRLMTNDKAIQSLLHKTIKKVTEDIEGMRFNTAISSLMVLANAFEKEANIPSALYGQFLILLSPFAPHITEELWQTIGNKKSIFLATWPKANPKYLKAEEVELVVQVNGKLRGRLKVAAGIAQKEAEAIALADAGVKAHTDGKQIRKVIYIQDKLISFVV